MWTSLAGVLGAFLALAAAPPPGPAEYAKRFATLVTQLGDDDFERRQQAERELVALGSAILPLIDRLGTHTDLEVRVRLRRIRLAVGGAVEELRDALAKLPPLEEERRAELPEALTRLISAHQPQTGDFLVGLAGAPKDPLHRQAVNAIVQTWDTMSPGQIETYLRHSLLPVVYEHRPCYPRGVDAMIGMGYQFRLGWASRPPASDRLQLVTLTTHYRDGKRYGKPYRYPYASSGCTTGWVRTGDLALGRHTVAMEVAFELEHRGKKLTGSVRSEEVAFEVVADLRDDLIAPRDAEVARQVRAALTIRETEEESPRGEIMRFPFAEKVDYWRPQITWNEAGKANGLHVPIWRVVKPLPVDVCFEVVLRLEGTKEEYPAGSLIVHRGTTRNLGYFCPNDVHKLAQGRSGFLPVRVILRPSRMLALTDAKVTRYFPEEVVSDVVRLKVGPPEVGPVRP
jgi:hypothetical protein